MKKNNFTILHVVAAYMVLIGHQFVLMDANPITICGMDIHGLGMKILFMISGYLVSTSYFRQSNMFRFFYKRISRLYPPLIVCLLITTLSMRLVSENSDLYWKSAATYVLHNIEMRPKFDLCGVFEHNPYPYGVNGSLWTMPLEIACYILLIPLLKAYDAIKKYSGVISNGFLILFLLSLSIVDFWRVKEGTPNSCIIWDTDWTNMISMGLYFFIGVVCCVLNLKRICNLQIGMLVAMLFICLPAYAKIIIAPYAIGYIVFSFALTDKPLFYSMIKHDICYGIYLYAFPVQQLLIYWLVVRKGLYINPYSMCLLSALITTVIAYLNYYTVERGMQIKSGKFNTRKDII